MRNLIASILLFAAAVTAQCNGTYPVLVSDAPGPFNTGCNGMTSFPGATPPWSSPIQWIGAANGGNLSIAWSQIPPPPFPSPTYSAWILLDVALLPSPVFVATGTPCRVIVGGGLLIQQWSIPSNGTCPLTLIGVIPPLPALQGITIYGQGVLNDPMLPLSWATTNAWQFTL